MRRRGAKPFGWRVALAEARSRLAQPPQSKLVKRQAPVGDLLACFAIPVDLCPTTNGTRRKPDWWYVKHRDELWTRLLPQFLESGLRRGVALPGRPQVLAVRFCPEAPDRYSDWAKSAIDRFILPLRIRRNGRLVDCKRWGFLADDDEESADVNQWWEPAPSSLECAYFEIRSGAD